MVHITTSEELAELKRECDACNCMAKWKVLPHEEAIDDENLEEILDKIKPEIEKVDTKDRSTSYSTVKIKEKFRINDLDGDTREDITRALCYYANVDKYIKAEEKLHSGFHRRLANFFIILYNDCLEDGYDGSQTYNVMLQWFRKRIDHMALDFVVAALVAYLFSKCDIFQKTEAEESEISE
ncbi:MAG: hypothetical protein K6G91_14515 [Kiritimatiellae bacterium]|nr:hypothetical protein [Kiritimatiellia bacterium]